MATAAALPLAVRAELPHVGEKHRDGGLAAVQEARIGRQVAHQIGREELLELRPRPRRLAARQVRPDRRRQQLHQLRLERA